MRKLYIEKSFLILFFISFFVFLFPQIIFADTGTALTPSCDTQSPPNAPNLYSITATRTTATLYFAPPTPPFDGYTIFYGLNQNADSYSAMFLLGPTTGAVKYTISHLTPNTIYYFKVRANNGCAPGPLSNTRSSKEIQKPPVAGPEDTFLKLGFVSMALFIAGITLFLAL